MPPSVFDPRRRPLSSFPPPTFLYRPTPRRHTRDKKSIEALYDRFETTGVTGPGNPRVKAVVRRLVTDLMLAIEDCFECEFPEEMLNRETFQSIQSISEALSALVRSS